MLKGAALKKSVCARMPSHISEVAVYIYVTLDLYIYDLAQYRPNQWACVGTKLQIWILLEGVSYF